MKQDEPFDPSIRSKDNPSGLIFRLAKRSDGPAICNLMHERNPTMSFSKIKMNTDRELDRVETDNKYRLYVAELNEEVIGFCRFYHSSGLPDQKKIYQAPEGWYAMGIMVDPGFRRQNIAQFLSNKRIEVLKSMGAKELYSIVDAKNKTSLKMHKSFGYIEIAKAEGFLHLKFEYGLGYLFKLNL